MRVIDAGRIPRHRAIAVGVVAVAFVRGGHVQSFRDGGRLSKSHLPPAELGQVLLRGAALEIDLEVHRREVGRRAAGEKRRLLLRKVGAVLAQSGAEPI